MMTNHIINSTNKRRTAVLLLFIYVSSVAHSQITEYFSGDQCYHYNVIYIDSIGDTITNENLKVLPTNKRWIFQPGKQKVVRYIYETDTSQYKNYRDPEDLFREMDKKYYVRKKKYRLTKIEKTGGYVNDSSFYLHPPRVNQYRMLFYSVHPYFALRSLNKKHDEFEGRSLNIIGMGKYIHNFVVDSLGKIKFAKEEVAVWEVNVESTLDPATDYFDQNKWKYKSTFQGLFCEEYGFIEMNYEFETGVKIEFRLKQVEEL
jgi:hypothetical protein